MGRNRLDGLDVESSCRNAGFRVSRVKARRWHRSHAVHANGGKARTYAGRMGGATRAGAKDARAGALLWEAGSHGRKSRETRDVQRAGERVRRRRQIRTDAKLAVRLEFNTRVPLWSPTGYLLRDGRERGERVRERVSIHRDVANDLRVRVGTAVRFIAIVLLVRITRVPTRSLLRRLHSGRLHAVCAQQCRTTEHDREITYF